MTPDINSSNDGDNNSSHNNNKQTNMPMPRVETMRSAAKVPCDAVCHSMNSRWPVDKGGGMEIVYECYWTEDNGSNSSNNNSHKRGVYAGTDTGR